jgi:hypothetical protein
MTRRTIGFIVTLALSLLVALLAAAPPAGKIPRIAILVTISSVFVTFGESASSSERIPRPRPVAGYDTEMLVSSAPSFGYDTDHVPPQRPRREAAILHRGIRRLHVWSHDQDSVQKEGLPCRGLYQER